MDCEKTGKLICKIRKEKNMTQKQLAEMLNLSDKAVSKWERGLGYPDVSVLEELCNLLGINLQLPIHTVFTPICQLRVSYRF